MHVPDELASIIEGLRRPQKVISPKWFYDETGSKLFDDITRLPEYYLTDTELDIMETHIGEMTRRIGANASLIEFGAGSSMKTRLLLEHMIDPAVYVPVDISEEHLLVSQRSIQADFPDIEVLPVAADFLRPFDLPNPRTMPERNVVYFPGSTIGNFENADALALLRVMHGEAGEGGALLIGVDLQKDPAVIHAAYNDSAGVTAEFNRTMLRHLNREFGSDFDLDAFEHRATYKPDEGRVVVELVSTRDQEARIGDARIPFARDESIITEYSHKYTLEGFAAMAQESGFSVDTVWTDPRDWFSVQYCTRE
jgi:L-histidine N-alpha-methyltransferase